MSPVNVKGILSSSTQMYSGSLGTSPKRGFLIKSQRVSAALIATDGSPGDATPSAWRTVAQPESARTSASHSVRRCFVPRPITAHKIAHTSYSFASHGGGSVTDSPRLRLRLALRPRDVLRLALQLRHVLDDGGAEIRALHFFRALHEAREVVGDHPGLVRLLQRTDNQVRGVRL